MPHDARRDEAPQEIRHMDRDQEQPPDQKQEQKHQKNCPRKPQLLADDGKYHIILGLRHKAQLLHAVSKARAKKPAGPDGVQPLEGLVALLIGLRVAPDGQALQAVGLHAQEHRQKAGSQSPHGDKLQIFRAGRKDQDHRDSHDDDGRAQVIRPHQAHDGQDEQHDKEHLPQGGHFPRPAADHRSQQHDHRKLGEFRGLEGQRPHREPPLRPVVLVSEKEHRRGQKQGQKVAWNRQLLPAVIIDLRHSVHGRKAQGGGEKLFFQVVGLIREFDLPVPGAGAVKHDKSEAHQDQHYQQQTVVERLPPLSFLPSGGFRTCHITSVSEKRLTRLPSA